MLYLLGLSYGAVSLALEGLGVYLCKSRIYDAVQETAKLVPGLTRDQVFAGVKTPALGGDLTSVKCKGEWLHLGITVDPISGLALTIDALPALGGQRCGWVASGHWREPRAGDSGLNALRRTGQESRAGAGHGSGNHASALCASNAPARGRASEFGLSSATLISRSMEPVASFDALPQVERVQRGNARWDQQCL